MFIPLRAYEPSTPMRAVLGLSYQQKETVVSQDHAGEFAASAELVFNIDVPGRVPADVEQRFADLIAEAFKKLFEEAAEESGAVTLEVFSSRGVWRRDPETSLPLSHVRALQLSFRHDTAH